jgi:hypothetical protein
MIINDNLKVSTDLSSLYSRLSPYKNWSTLNNENCALLKVSKIFNVDRFVNIPFKNIKKYFFLPLLIFPASFNKLIFFNGAQH